MPCATLGVTARSMIIPNAARRLAAIGLAGDEEGSLGMSIDVVLGCIAVRECVAVVHATPAEDETITKSFQSLLAAGFSWKPSVARSTYGRQIGRRASKSKCGMPLASRLIAPSAVLTCRFTARLRAASGTGRGGSSGGV
jgi:hypothetical protein